MKRQLRSLINRLLLAVVTLVMVAEIAATGAGAAPQTTPWLITGNAGTSSATGSILASNGQSARTHTLTPTASL
jgi:hypothetical protein